MKGARVKPDDTYPLELSWPLFERQERLCISSLLQSSHPELTAVTVQNANGHELARHGIGLWECNLADGGLTWSAGVYDLFGLPRGAQVIREDALALYGEESRVIMERLRAYAIKHRRGFTMDAEIRPSLTRRRRMRLIAAPVCEGRKVVRLYGVKQAI